MTSTGGLVDRQDAGYFLQLKLLQYSCIRKWGVPKIYMAMFLCSVSNAPVLIASVRMWQIYVKYNFLSIDIITIIDNTGMDTIIGKTQYGYQLRMGSWSFLRKSCFWQLLAFVEKTDIMRLFGVIHKIVITMSPIYYWKLITKL